MPTQAWQRNAQLISTFWRNVLSGQGAQIPSPPATTERIEGQIYDVGDIVRGYNDTWLKVSPNAVTPANLRSLLNYLDEMTGALEARSLEVRSQLQGPLTGGTGETVVDCAELGAYGHPGLVEPCIDLARWRVRLDEYLMLANLVPPEQDFDRTETLWTITAPLFVGWYGGPTGTEVELPEGGFAPGFNPQLHHPPDIATPYMLANEFGIEHAWEQERRQRLLGDLTPKLDPRVSAGLGELGKILVYTAIGAAGLIVLTSTLRR
jgi:hypothetical protein